MKQEKEQVREVMMKKLREWGFSDEEIKDEERLSALGLDSLDRVELLMYCENTFNLEEVIPDDKFKRVRTVGEFIDLFC